LFAHPIHTTAKTLNQCCWTWHLKQKTG